MARFDVALLGLMGRLYRPVGDIIAPGELELGLPIQVVHDVSREIELGKNVHDFISDGYFVNQIVLTHAIADTQVATSDPYTVMGTGLGVFHATHRPWLLRHSVELSVAQLTSLGVLAWVPAIAGATQPRSFVLHDLGASVSTFTNETAAADIIKPATRIANTGEFAQTRLGLPFMMFPGGAVSARSVSAAALTVTVYCLYYAAPIGSLPPGVA